MGPKREKINRYMSWTLGVWLYDRRVVFGGGAYVFTIKRSGISRKDHVHSLTASLPVGHCFSNINWVIKRVFVTFFSPIPFDSPPSVIIDNIKSSNLHNLISSRSRSKQKTFAPDESGYDRITRTQCSTPRDDPLRHRVQLRRWREDHQRRQRGVRNLKSFPALKLNRHLKSEPRRRRRLVFSIRQTQTT